MVTLDNIKIKAPIHCIRAGGREYFRQSNPYMVRVYVPQSFRYWCNIIFSSKILLDDYPLFINKNNIRRCLERVKEISQINLDIDLILQEGLITNCDFTKDLSISDLREIDGDLKKLKILLPLCLNNQEYECARYRNHNIRVRKTVSPDSDRSKFQLTIYNKNKEIRSGNNESFRIILNDEQALLNYFHDKVRFELRAFSPVQIKRWLSIHDTHINTVLNSEANPIRTAILEVFQPVNTTDEEIKLADQNRIALMKQCEWDIGRIEAIVREHSGKNWNARMDKYRQLYLKFNPELNDINQVNIADWV